MRFALPKPPAALDRAARTAGGVLARAFGAVATRLRVPAPVQKLLDRRSEWTVPIRLKIVLLTVVALIIALASSITLGTSLFVEDKLSYIYDYNISHLRVTAEIIERKVAEAARTVTALAAATSTRNTPEARELRTRAISRVLAARGKQPELRGVQIFSIVNDDQFVPVAGIGQGLRLIPSTIAQLGWSPRAVKRDGLLLGPARKGMLPLVVSALNSDAEAVAGFAWLQPRAELFVDIPREFQTQLVDVAGKTLYSTLKLARPQTEQGEVDALEASLRKGAQDAGVQDWKIGGRDYLVGYRKLLRGQLTVFTFIPRDLAFATARTLVIRSVFMGVSILLMVVAGVLLFARGITRRLRQMWEAAERLGRGEFETRVNAGGGVRDEVTSLASALNTMAARIQDLMTATAEKVRMEQELQTAELVQASLLPPREFNAGGVSIAAYHDHATECGGDWWHYAEIKGRIYVWIGDATGHGAPAALLTAAARSAVTMIEKFAPESPSACMAMLNEALYTTSRGKLTMTFFVAVLDPATGRLAYANAGHEVPYLIRHQSRPITKQDFDVLNQSKGLPLGENPDHVFEECSVQLAAGDTIVLYTDGMPDLIGPDEERIGKGKLVRILCRALTEQPAAQDVVGAVRAAADAHRKGVPLDDDVTFLVYRYQPVTTLAAPSEPEVAA